MGCLQQALQVVCDTIVYLGVFCYLWLWQQPINKLEVFGEQRLPLCHVYMLAKTLQLWDAPHYRAATFAEDLRANLKNVAIPGTGIPMSVFCHSKLTALLFILVVNPIISLAAAVYSCYSSQQHPLQQEQQTQSAGSTNHSSQPAGVASTYRQFLLFPSHWFAIWRHSCLLVGYHALVTGSSSYQMEGKGTFLLEGQRLGLPVSPFYSDATVFVKHVSVEGGMGIHVFRNFAQGGEWVIQRALSNSESLSRMLPPGAPLSTLRVVTASTAWLEKQTAQHSRGAYSKSTWLQQQQQAAASDGCGNGLQMPTAPGNSEQVAGRRGRGNSGVNSSSSGTSSSSTGPVVGRLTPELPLSATVMQQHHIRPSMQHDSSKQHDSSNRNTAASSQDAAAGQAADSAIQQPGSDQLYGGQVRVVTAVWRAGLAGKDTDHSSICFPMDAATGVLSRGVSANHWYRLGLPWLGRIDGSTAGQTWQQHPDSGVTVAGVSIPAVEQIMHTVMQAHMVATPDVPLVGWDVALTPSGVYLLEMNLSCNLFNGNFASDAFYHNIFRHLEALEAAESSWRQACGERHKRC